MQSRRLGKTGWDVSEIGFGAWAIGGEWGETDEEESMAALHAAVDAGVTFFDTADVYGDGRSERLLGRLLRERDERLVVATKFGRRVEQDPALFTYENLRGWLERSRENLGVEAVDLVQLHSPPWETYYLPEVHEACSRLVQEGLVRAYGVSVEKVEEGLKAIEYDGVATIQLIFNLLRQRPAELFFEQARRRDVGVIVRVPLASGLLTGKFDRNSTFAAEDHRAYNRQGEQFDRGETFSGVDYEVGLE
ncbi:MAG TPA: aldo/keto reductase, partial [Gaiellaceae bacterium]|nr:aldo/keto reductase [Gaiellaceae bacterium]